MPMVQPSRPGGGSPTTMSPAPPTRARVIPWARRTSMAACRGVTLGDPADVELHPGLLELDGPSRRIEQHLVRADECAGLGELPGSGSLRSRRARRQSRPTGAIVTSKTPLGPREIAWDRARTSNRSALTGTGGPPPSGRAGTARSRAGSRSSVASRAAIRRKPRGRRFWRSARRWSIKQS